MNTYANSVIDALGGTTATAAMISAPVSTVHGWRKIGIPPAHMAHIRLLAKLGKMALPEAE